MEQNDAELRTKNGSRKASTVSHHHKIQTAKSHPLGGDHWRPRHFRCPSRHSRRSLWGSSWGSVWPVLGPQTSHQDPRTYGINMTYDDMKYECPTAVTWQLRHLAPLLFMRWKSLDGAESSTMRKKLWNMYDILWLSCAHITCTYMYYVMISV